MSRKLVAACIAALMLSSAAHAEGQQYFVSGALGASDGRLDGRYGASDRFDGHDVAGALRVGVMWRGALDWGVEAGYVDLGEVSDQYVVNLTDVKNRVRTRGLAVGGRVTYRFDAPWYLSAHGGLLHSWADLRASAGNPSYAVAGTRASGNGWYLGAGGGYDVSEQFSVGLHYDLHHVKASRHGAEISGHVGTLMVQLEYRY